MIVFNDKMVPTKELFFFLKYNQVIEKIERLSEKDELVYKEFCRKYKK
ncbi:unnamed protein product, partial [marine sediment metagenome]